MPRTDTDRRPARSGNDARAPETAAAGGPVAVAAIARALGADWAGDGALTVSGVAEPGQAGPDDLALAMDAKHAARLGEGRARAAVLWPGADWQALGLEAAIFVARPRYAMAGLTGLFARPLTIAPGIHPSAVIDPSARIGPGAAIGPLTVIGPGVRIGARVRIEGSATVAEGAVLGDDCLLHAGVRIGSRVRIGDRFIAHYNAVVGADGFSFVTPERSAVEAARESLTRGQQAAADRGPQHWERIASVASVTVGDDVELGACSTIDKGTVADTRIGDRTKIDNHVQIGHNVRVGADCLLCAHAAVAGSSVLGDRVVLGGQAGVADHLVLGDDVIAAGATAILSNVPAGRVMMGYPAMEMKANIAAYKALRRLPRLAKRVEELQRLLSNRKRGGTGE